MLEEGRRRELQATDVGLESRVVELIRSQGSPQAFDLQPLGNELLCKTHCQMVTLDVAFDGDIIGIPELILINLVPVLGLLQRVAKGIANYAVGNR